MLEASARGSREWRQIFFENVLPSLHTPKAGVGWKGSLGAGKGTWR